jgi:ketosteroid isomerase-like protein
MSDSPTQTVLSFIDRINEHDEDKLADLMTDDHVFVDSLGNAIKGKEKVRAAWKSYFAFCPDYRIAGEEFLQSGDNVGAFGTAGGTIRVNSEMPPENRWKIPAAWKAVIVRGLVREWRVYADNKPVYDIMTRSQKPK